VTASAASSGRELLSAWLGYLEDERRASPRTLEAYGRCVGAYLNFLERHRGEAVSGRALGAVSAADLRAYLASRRRGEHPLSPRSIGQALAAIRAFYVWLDRADWEAARDRAVLTLLYGCGLRISEALSLTRAEAPLSDTLRIIGKGSKTRIVPVLPAVRDAIDAYVAELPFALSPEEPLFRAARGGPLSPRHVQGTVQKLRGRLGLPRAARNSGSSGESAKGSSAT
jgi:integrase/recombinase XerC